MPYSPTGFMLSMLDLSTKTKNFKHQYTQSVHDALWALSSQYMLGQFKGEDAGSALLARVYYDTRKINRFQPANGEVAHFDGTAPLDVLIERQKIVFDLGIQIQTGRYWKKMLKKHGIEGYADNFAAAFPISLAFTPEEIANTDESELRQSLHGRTTNGGDLHEYLTADGIKKAEDLMAEMNDRLSEPEEEDIIDSNDEEKLDAAITDFLNFISGLYNHSTNESAWNKSRLEYAAKCSFPIDVDTGAQQVLVAEEYNGSGTEWSTFDRSRESNDTLTEDISHDITNSEAVKSGFFEVLPNPVTFKGMPTDRWWQIHDARTNLFKWDNDKSDVTGTMMKDFALTFNPDWLQIPFSLEAGSFTEVKHLVVKDIFGFYHYVGGEKVTMPANNWDVFKQNKQTQFYNTDTRFYYSARVKALESEILEKVSLQRDEMANMVWAVESLIYNGIGGTRDGAAAALKLTDFHREHTYKVDLFGHSQEKYDYSEEESTYDILRYKLLNSTPENWIPFIPHRTDEENMQIRFQRARFRRIIKGSVPNEPLADDFVQPRTSFLRHGLDSDPHEPYFIFEEEIPRAGAIVFRQFKRVRWHDGSVHVWLSNQKTTGRGETLSHLQFDTLEKKYDDEYRERIRDRYMEPDYAPINYSE
ncbi:MAG: hypothetical protein KF882_02930 [Bacteroidia bacterium]|nr:hypothetical protein [Bacteroidia bacterium]